MPYPWTSAKRHFPTLLLRFLERSDRYQHPYELSSVAFRRRMTRRRVIAGAIVAITFSLIGLAVGLNGERRRRFEGVAAKHELKLIYGISESRTGPPTYTDGNGKIMTTGDVEAVGWHAKLAQKYRTAATRPWLPVESDPPRPEPSR